MATALASAKSGVARAKFALASCPLEAETDAVRHQQICPVSLASEVLEERWTPLILREIVLFDRHHVSEIQRGVGRISQSLLSTRLRTLVEAGRTAYRPRFAYRMEWWR